MPFYLYRTEQISSGVVLERQQVVQLAGTSGPLYSYVNRTKRAKHFPWQIDEAGILAEISGPPSPDPRLIVDLKPSAKRNVSLYIIRRIWGYSYEEWTPIAVQLEGVFVDVEVENPEQFKQRFVLEPEMQHDIVHEFLYLQGGTAKGSWNWGMVGRVNGALLWPDAMRFFLGELSRYLGQQVGE